MPKKIKRHAKREVRRAKKKGFKLFFFRGDAAISFLIIAVVIIGSLMLVGGTLTPKLNKQDPNNVGVPDISSFPTGVDSNLQLKTFKFKQCADTAAIYFLLDTSGSMAYNNGIKIGNLRDSVTYFANSMSNTSVSALREFSTSTSLRVPVGIGNKNKIISAVSSLVPGGATHTRNAFDAAKGDLAAAVANSKFAKYNFNVIFFTDGIPETQENANALCSQNPPPADLCDTSGISGLKCRCFAQDQDPTSTANAIKAMKSGTGKSIRIFSIFLFDPARDGFFASRAKPLVQGVASPDSYFETTDSTQLKSIFSQISGKVCN